MCKERIAARVSFREGADGESTIKSQSLEKRTVAQRKYPTRTKYNRKDTKKVPTDTKDDLKSC